MTAEEQIAKLEERHQEERAKLDKELALVRLLPPDLVNLDRFVHIHKLYDQVGSIHFEHPYAESLRKGPDPSLDTLIRCAEVFPPVDLAIFRDTFVSVTTLANARVKYEHAQSRMAEGHETSARVQPIANFWCTFASASHSNNFEVEYIGQTAIGLVNFKISLPIWGETARKVGYVSITRETGYSSAQGRKDQEYDRPTIQSKIFVPTPAVQVLGNGKYVTIDRPNSADRREPGEIEVCWDSANGGCCDATLASLAKAIQ